MSRTWTRGAVLLDCVEDLTRTPQDDEALNTLYWSSIHYPGRVGKQHGTIMAYGGDAMFDPQITSQLNRGEELLSMLRRARDPTLSDPAFMEFLFDVLTRYEHERESGYDGAALFHNRGRELVGVEREVVYRPRLPDTSFRSIEAIRGGCGMRHKAAVNLSAAPEVYGTVVLSESGTVMMMRDGHPVRAFVNETDYTMRPDFELTDDVRSYWKRR
ncbi:MAG: hypothetical protein KKA90_02665 [Nanoarchaeota archaeon]|nr:hypothetical protein [Nanoarchaeota archaeon]